MRHTITCTERITLAPNHAHRVLHPHDTEKIYPVYTIDGVKYIEIKGDTMGGILLTKISDLHVMDGELNAIPAPMRVDEKDMPVVYPQDVQSLKDITDQVPAPRMMDKYRG